MKIGADLDRQTKKEHSLSAAAGIHTTPIRTDLLLMDCQIKLLRGLDQGNFAIIITRGLVDLAGFEYVLDAVIDQTRSLLDCKVLIDFQDSILHFRPPDVANFLASFHFEKWPHNHRIALVSSQDPLQYRRLGHLAGGLATMKLEVRPFCDTREAIDWLTGIRR